MSSSKEPQRRTQVLPEVGALVTLPMHRGEQRGIVVNNTCETGWCDVLLDDGELVKWPSVQLKVVENESR